MSRALRFFWRQMNVQLRMRVLSGYTLILLLVQPAIFSGVGYALARMAGRAAPDLIYTIVGGGVMGLWSGVLFTSFFDITRDRAEGTLELIAGSPMPLNTVLGVRVLTNVLVGSLALGASLLTALALFHLSLSFEKLPAVAVSLVVVMFSFWCVGVLLANFHAWSRVFSTAINYVEMPVAVLGAFMFPASVLPAWLLPFSALLPLRWAVAALNGSLAGAPESAPVWPAWCLALGLSAAYLAAARWLSARVHDQIRVSGELSSI